MTRRILAVISYGLERDLVELPKFVNSGEVARLIPVIADSRKEQRVVSVFLATLVAVPDFAQSILSSIGQRIGNRTQIDSFTEVVLENQKNGAKDRPDGLLAVDFGRKTWAALIEAKIGSAKIEVDQVQRYVQLARENDLEAVITISNEFAGKPSHGPVSIPKNQLRKVSLYHWSWKFILTEAILLQSRSAISDPDQAFILREFIRFASHDSVGIKGFESMPTEWTTLLTHVQGGGVLKRNSNDVEAVISAWHQEIRDLSLRMSHHLAVNVENKISRIHGASQEQRLKDDSTGLADRYVLETTLEIPGAASDLNVVADLKTRTINVGMRIDAPQDRQRGIARVNWLLRQLKQIDSDDVFVSAIWPSRAQDTICPLESLRENPNMIFETSQQVPRAFQIFRISYDARRFAGRRTFIEEIERAVPMFYDSVGQYLKQWRPKAPKPVEPSEKPYAPDGDENGLAKSEQTLASNRPTPGNDHDRLLDIPEFLRRIPGLVKGSR